MGTLHDPGDGRPLDIDSVPAEEGLSRADAAERLEHDPDEQLNATDPDSDVELDAPQERVDDSGHD